MNFPFSVLDEYSLKNGNRFSNDAKAHFNNVQVFRFVGFFVHDKIYIRTGWIIHQENQLFVSFTSRDHANVRLVDVYLRHGKKRINLHKSISHIEILGAHFLSTRIANKNDQVR